MTRKQRPGRIVGESLRNLLKKPATIDFPTHGVAEPKVERNYRGRLLYDADTCINCRICMRDCPAAAITILNEGTKEAKKMRAVLNLGRCVFCCQCVDSCPKNSLSYSQTIDLSVDSRDALKVDLKRE